VILLIVYLPAHSFFQSGVFPSRFWPLFLVGWAYIFLVSEPRRWLCRYYTLRVVPVLDETGKPVIDSATGKQITKTVPVSKDDQGRAYKIFKFLQW